MLPSPLMDRRHFLRALLIAPAAAPAALRAAAVATPGIAERVRAWWHMARAEAAYSRLIAGLDEIPNRTAILAQLKVVSGDGALARRGRVITFTRLRKLSGS